MKYKNYEVSQASNNHVSIFKNGTRVFHAQCNAKKSEDELIEMVNFYESLSSSRNEKKFN